MPRVVALYRYPVKGFTPERCETLEVLDEGRIAGDRALAFRFADSDAPDDAWTPKQQCVVLMNTPGLARLQVRYDHAARRLRIARDGAVIAEASLDEAGRQQLAAALAAYAQSLEVNPLAGLTPGYSDLPLMAERTGMSYRTLIGEIVRSALERLDAR